jgi:hypothetical protein
MLGARQMIRCPDADPHPANARDANKNARNSFACLFIVYLSFSNLSWIFINSTFFQTA